MKENISSLFRHSSIFFRLRKSDLNNLEKVSSRISFKKDEIILKESEQGDKFFVIVDGQVKVSRLGDKGKEVILAILETGDFFGEIALFDGQERTANITVMKNTEVLLIKREDLIHLLKKVPELALGLLRQMCYRIRIANAQIKSMSILNTSGRVATVLLNLLGPVSDIRGEKLEIKNAPSNTNMARMAGLTRESFSRCINLFLEMGWIMREGSAILIEDRENLENISG